MPTALTDDGLNISYEVRGDGPADLLLMHGWAGSGAYWDETVGQLDLGGLRVITYDMRGHGGSGRAEKGFDLERIAGDALAVADAAGAERFVAVGFSMSAKFAQYLSCSNPGRVRGQVLVAGAPAGEIPFPAETFAYFMSCAGDRGRMSEMLSRFVKEPLRPEVLSRFLDDAVKVPLGALEETLGACINTSFADRLAGACVRTLVVGGAHDPIFSPEVLRRGVAAPVPGARVTILDCSHEIPVERPRELAALIEAFVAGLGDGQG